MLSSRPGTFEAFGLSRDKFVGWLDFDTRTLPNGPVTIRTSAFNVPAGQPGAIDWVAMSPRTWIINNSAMPPGFTANLASAPSDGAIVSGTVRIELRGTGIANAELLPASGYTPRHSQFNVSADKTYAWIDFDTRALPGGPADQRLQRHAGAGRCARDHCDANAPLECSKLGLR